MSKLQKSAAIDAINDMIAEGLEIPQELMVGIL